ncbi:hypothetical protein C0989_001688 [Termitomyces sp. Mn162]|nr:hypothetical protein C0989_001688 [Termitomyces sp. Mn162]
MLGLSPTHSSEQKANTKLNSKPKLKKVKVTPFVANYKSGSETALLLLGQIDAILEANPIANGQSLAAHKNFKKQCEVVEPAAEQQLVDMKYNSQILRSHDMDNEITVLYL